MSTEIKDQAAVESPVVVQMPDTPEALKVFVAYTLTDLLNIPENGTHFARVVLSAALKALNNSAQQSAQQATRPVLSRTPYAGCLRGVVAANEEASDEPLSVDLTAHDVATDTWVESTLPASVQQNVAKLILSQSTVPGDVWYVTTNHAVDKLLDATAASLMANAEVDVQG